MDSSPRQISLEETNRAAHFRHFCAYALPYTSITASVDVKQLVKRCEARKQSVFAAMLYAIMRAANSIPQLRQRIRDRGIVEYARIHPAFTILRDDESLRFCPTDFSDDRTEFLRSVAAAMAEEPPASKQLDPHPERDDQFFVSSLPWLAFTSLQHPARTHADDSVPRIAWGKFVPDGEALPMPLNLQAHHALVDGLHMARFFEAAQVELDRDW